MCASDETCVCVCVSESLLLVPSERTFADVLRADL